MKKYLKHLLFATLLVSSMSFLFGYSEEKEALLPAWDTIQVDDSIPRYPVKPTQIKTYDDLISNSPIDLKDPSNVTTTVDYDPVSNTYIFRTKIGDQIISTPYALSSTEYQNYSLKKLMSDYFRQQNSNLTKDGKDKNEFSLKDVKINIGPAERLFGPGGVKISASGYVEAKMGIKQTFVDNPTLSERNRKKTAFDFDEDINVSLNASVGDRVNFGMNYDTKSMFDFDSKKIRLAYDGSEDEIVKHIAAGNVSMATTNSLINGGTALFGINTELQFGKLRVNTIVSQQESENQSVNAKGGVQTSNFEFKADEYDENRHFFLAHYFRDNYNKAMSKLPFVSSPISITKIEVWITNKRADYGQARNIVAFADIGERDSIQNTSKWQLNPGAENAPYNEANTLHQEVTTTYKGARDIQNVTATFQNVIESGLDYEKIENARLLSPSEYTFNPQLGYVSLNTALQADEVLAVSFEFVMKGITYKMGELSTDIVDKVDENNPKSGVLFVKLLKPVSLSPQAYTWDLMMKNVYNIGATGIQQDKFKLNISYQSDTIGTYINYLPEGKIKNQMLIKVMNLDRLDSKNNARPDGIFDYIEGYTIRSENGRIYFPVVEPFGSHLAAKIGNPAIAEKYVYKELYTMTKTAAQQIAEKNKFKIYGSYRGSASNNDIMLNATNVPQGSVRVTARGRPLIEGVDYIVDYMAGMVTIINQNLIDSDTPVQVSLEDRTFSMQRKTLLGLNLSYDVSKDFNVGGTIMHMYEKPLTTKTEIGGESVKNTLWGFNTSYKKESQWLTNMIDKLPFVEAVQPSQISFNGEFAQLVAGHYQNREVGAYSYLDDFETSQSRIDIKSPYAWSLASTPANKEAGDMALFPEATLTDDIKYGKRRAHLAWFMIDGLFTRKNSSLTPQHIKNDPNELSNHFVREVYMWELYPKRDIAFNEAVTLPVLNLSYYPQQRGPYNLDAEKIDSEGNFIDPKKRWGGITRKMDIRDFETSNIEYIEFWLMDPFAMNNKLPESQKNKGGDLYFNLGEISEDVLKDGKKFFENGLPLDDDPSAYTTTEWGKVPTRQSTVYAFDDKQGEEGRRKQDVGLNGLSTDEEFNTPNYANYVRDFKRDLSREAKVRLAADQFSPLNDPAGDNYHFYRGADFDQQKKGVLDRYKHYNGTEGNSSGANSDEKFASAARSVPDVEDIDQDNTLNETESYYQYKVTLDPNGMNVGSNHIVDSRTVSVPLRNGTEENITWYQFKIPVRSGEKIGKIQGFKSIRFMRMFLTNFAQETFLRFGTLQLVRGDWRVYEQPLDQSQLVKGTVDISTVNIEENNDRKPVSYVLPPGLNRVLDPDQTQLTKENEQSLSMKVMGLESGDARAIYKNSFYDLRRYKRLQLFTHAEELVEGEEIKRDEISVFLRLGSDYKNNYYEYEIPLTITPHGNYSHGSDADREAVWPTENMFDFQLSVLKNLKLERNREKRMQGSTVSYTSLYTSYDPEKKNNKISIIGNPSLSEVNIIMVGVRNNSRKTKGTEVWVNELRLTDFDDEGGWAAQGNLNIALSDLGNVNFSGRKETVGFGGIDQSMMERRQDDYQMYNLATNVDVGRFLPQKAKLSIPFYYSYSSETTTPKYDPFDQDITLDESLAVVNTKQERDSIKSLALERTISKSVSFNNVKLNIKSKTPMPYDPANFAFGYTYNGTDYRNPTTAYDLSKNYKAQMNYSYSPLMKTWEPFKKNTGKSGSDKYLRTIGFNYLPSNIGFNSVITRHYTETLTRDIEGYVVGENNAQNTFLSYSQEFYWDRDFNINWDITRNLRMAFQSGTRAEIEEPYQQVNKKLERGKYEEWRDSVWRSIKSLGTPLSYRQTATVTYQLPWRNIPAMNWASSEIKYNSGYQWDRGAEIEDVELGNIINNNITIDFNNRFNLTTLYNKSKYLKKINDRFDNRKSTDSRRQQESPTQRQRKEREEQEKRKRYTQNVQLQADGKTSVKHNLQTKSLEITAKKDGKTYKVKYKKIDENTIQINNKDSANIEINIFSKIKDQKDQIWTDIAEYSVRGLMSTRSLSVNYARRKETHLSGYIPRVGNAFGQRDSEYGLAPGMGFAFGLEGGEDFIEKARDRDWLVINDMNITPAIYNTTEKLELLMQLEPLKGLKIDLNANREKNDRTEIQYMYSGMPRTFGGSFSMTTVALSSALRSGSAKNNYESKAFDDFLKNRNIIKSRLEQRYDGTKYPSSGFLENHHLGSGDVEYDPNNVGGVNINSGDVMIPAFIAAYTGKDVNKVSLSAFPSLLAMLPNWKVSYDGLSNVPAIKRYFKSIQFNHAYTCYYQVGNYTSFTDWVRADGDLGYIRDVLNGNPIPSSPYNISSVNIAEMFNPLFGVETVLNSNISIGSQFNNMRTINLNMSSYQIIEALQKEIIVNLGYRISEFNRLIGLSDKSPNNFNNDLNIIAGISYKNNQALIRKIQERFTQATSGTDITTLRLSADYTISRSLSLRAFFDKIINKPLISSNGYATTNTNFGISVKFTLQP